MHIINFLLAIFLPYITLFSKLAPPETIPHYFSSEEAAFVAGEFGVIIFYWAGFLRNYVIRGVMTERQYFSAAAGVLVFMCASKIVFTLPYTWITDIFAFGLGVLSQSSGQRTSKRSLWLLIGLSAIIFAYSTFVLLGMAWLGFEPLGYEHYKDLMQIYAYDIWYMLKSIFA
jgi:hypothetical protein